MNSFSESQKFRQWWLWAVIAGSLVLPVAVAGISAKGVQVLPPLVIGGVVILLFWLMELRTTIDAAGVSFRFFPFHLKPRVKSWDEIESAYVRKYSPLGEFGGWGIRITFGNGTAYNVSGNMGLQLVLKNGKKLLIGTRHPDEIMQVLQTLGKASVPAGGK